MVHSPLLALLRPSQSSTETTPRFPTWSRVGVEMTSVSHFILQKMGKRHFLFLLILYNTFDTTVKTAMKKIALHDQSIINR